MFKGKNWNQAIQKINKKGLPPRRRRSLSLERLESREVPSVAPVGLLPSTIKHAYGIDTISFSGTAGTGAGQTIAIVLWNDDPGMVSSTSPGFATSDLKMFDTALGLPDPPSFLKVNQMGGTTYPAADAGASKEISLDVEWAHAIAPAASIVLVEATTSSYPDIVTAIDYASHIPGVSVVSMSFGSPEFVGELALDKHYVSPGVTFLESTGDKGAPGEFGAYNPYVVAIGGTTLMLAGSEYGKETGWSGSGGGISAYESKPAYQFLTPTPSATKRTIPDVSFDADPASGVAVLDSYVEPPGSPWIDSPPAARVCHVPVSRASSPSPIRAEPSMACPH
jgi:subtilase family serine protease